MSRERDRNDAAPKSLFGVIKEFFSPDCAGVYHDPYSITKATFRRGEAPKGWKRVESNSSSSQNTGCDGRGDCGGGKGQGGGVSCGDCSCAGGGGGGGACGDGCGGGGGCGACGGGGCG